MESPTSENTATERHADAKRDGEDLPCTQDLTRGTQDVNNGNVGHTQDPCTSLEALVQGTSAKRAEMTPVVLKSALPHETQTEPHSSLPLTPRPPIEGEPNGCKQEVADSVVTAGRTKRTVETAKPQFADVDGKAVLAENWQRESIESTRATWSTNRNRESNKLYFTVKKGISSTKI